MTDTISRSARSELMGRVRQKDTKPEMVVRRILHSAGFRYVLHPGGLPGRPDIVFPRYGVVLFVHGCFWHGHDCRAGRAPSSNSSYWSTKIAENRCRDERKSRELQSLGWRVAVIWECETKGSLLKAHSSRWAALIKDEGISARTKR
ncbi:very short patch repair endonuclease [Piscinibacter gummiphilus]|uniref:Very short patch repair endonuclease n=1 Tax=Piscinibacter gummiphilus TaxID=946333 RepID=A0A1W6L2F3_9BURK|nr:very short patch repair endonuclease [Piscinibacter gummiphilus]ATU63072.1 very short patch repair endonuclease [Piscinibacter gummiphilus]